MGLDMYLHATKFVSNWPFNTQAEKDLYRGIATALGLSDKDFEHMRDSGQSVELKIQIAYWRKANAIHRWFVEKCQGGTDDCRQAYVSREQLVELLGACKEVLGTIETVDGEVHNGTSWHPDGTVVKHMEPGRIVAQAAIAERVLPTQGGFFFGNTDYNEYYLEDLEATAEQLEAILNNEKFNDCSFEYYSSW